jgi:alpha-L-glutamate ligase-like protein
MARRWRFWASSAELRREGVLGINHRNAVCVLPNNPRAFYPRVDDKLKTKEICEAHQIPVPETYAVIRRHGDIRRLRGLLKDRGQFVVKPAEGAEGRGILVVADRDGEQLVTSFGEKVSLGDLGYHVSTILSGLYSLAGQPDSAIIEQRIVRHPVFDGLAVGGTPDIRIILYRGVPVMAMVRLPTQASRGRANLHQGAVAAGIHLATGRSFGGVCKGHVVTVHPDTGASIEGCQLPAWPDLLMAAMNLADALELGYLGVDFVLDATRGPVILEANARPGLAIQVANRCGLLPRLQLVDQKPPKTATPQDRMELVGILADLG